MYSVHEIAKGYLALDTGVFLDITTLSDIFKWFLKGHWL